MYLFKEEWFNKRSVADCLQKYATRFQTRVNIQKQNEERYYIIFGTFQLKL